MSDEQFKEIKKEIGYIHSQISRIEESVSEIKNHVKDKNSPMIKQLKSLEEYIIGLTNALDNN